MGLAKAPVERFFGSVGSGSFAGDEHRLGGAVPDEMAQIPKRHAHHRRSGEQPAGRANAIAQGLVRGPVGLDHTRGFGNQGQRPLVRHDHQQIHGFPQAGKTDRRRPDDECSLAFERQDDKGQHLRPGFAGQPGDQRADARARATPQTGNNKYHPRTATGLSDRGFMLAGFRAGAFGIATTAEAAQAFGFHGQLQAGRRRSEGIRLQINRHALSLGQASVNHPFKHIHTGGADAEHANSAGLRNG